MENQLTLDILSKDWDRVLEELSKGNIVVARSKNDFIYIIDVGREYHLFSHTPGLPGGGEKTFPKNEKNTAIIRNFTNMADTMFLVEYEKGMNIYGVLASAEEGILNAYPGDDRDSDETVEFIIPQKKKKE
ncbi:MAG: hypothetical protein PVG39_31380 [Desulfobacteraceae bacterium]|jgi:hypothetical protein